MPKQDKPVDFKQLEKYVYFHVTIPIIVIYFFRHLPAYLVAAFTKKLSRLALTAPPGGLTVIVPFIYNLINRHPHCKMLLHRTDGPQGEYNAWRTLHDIQSEIFDDYRLIVV